MLEVADVSCGTTSCAAGGSGGRERSVCLQTAVGTHPARAMPPSPEVMPHDTIGEVVANLLALRFAPRSCCRSRESITPRIPGRLRIHSAA